MVLNRVKSYCLFCFLLIKNHMNNFWGLFKKPWIENWAETFQYIVIGLGIIASGIWAFHTFDTLLQKDRALADLQKAEAELQKTEADLNKTKVEFKELQERIKGVDSSVIELKVEQFGTDKGTALLIDAVIQNTGTNDVNMSWSESPLKVYKVKYRGDELKGESSFRPLLYDQLQDQTTNKKSFIQNVKLFVGAKKSLSFFVELNEQGLYYIVFEANVEASVKDKLDSNNGKPVWFASKYIYINSK